MGEDVDERSDVYSLGVVLYEMLTADVPYHADTQIGVAMRHVHDPMPDVQERRPDVSAALAAVIDQATAKEVENRHGSVEELLEDLESTLDLEAARGGGASGQATAVLDTVPAKRRMFTRPGRASGAGIAMGVIGAGLIIAALVVGEKQLSSGSGNAIDLAPGAAAAFDPASTGGDGAEHSEDAKLAIDGNATGTSWPTETYDTDDFGGKPGVGLSIDAGKPVTASAIEARADASGWDAEVRAAPGSDQVAPRDLSGWDVIGKGTDLGTKAKITIDNPTASRYYLLWITKLPSGEGGFKLEISDLSLLE
jgi:serine/threonine-protein kinase